MKLIFKAFSIKNLTNKDTFENALFNFFYEHSNPPDKDVHNLAAQFDMDPDDLEEQVYVILSTFASGGKAKEKKAKLGDVDPKELQMGIKVEMEHLDKSSPYAKLMAARIALDHLAEAKDWKNPKYYSGLKSFEDKMKKGVSI
jgi:KaiC/GvpD/RAD55 family RecA-like ATPase